MTDPYSNLAAAPLEVQDRLTDIVIARAVDPTQQAMRRQYLGGLKLPSSGRAVEFGSGAGDVTRELIEIAGATEAIGVEPSPVMVQRARARHADVQGLTFLEGDAAKTGMRNASVDLVVMHTLLCHALDAEALIAEAARILKPGATVAVFDGDYELSSAALSRHDPLQALVDRAVEGYVRDRWLPRRIQQTLIRTGFTIRTSQIFGYSAAKEPTYFLTVIDRGADALVFDGVIGPSTSQALKQEARRRVAEGAFFASMSYICIVAERS